MRDRLCQAGKYLWMVLLGVFLIVPGTKSFAQDTNASLSGTVSDPTGAVIPGAKLTLTNKASGFQQAFESDSAGEYNFRNLTPGIYDLAIVATNFHSENRTGLELAVNQA